MHCFGCLPTKHLHSVYVLPCIWAVICVVCVGHSPCTEISSIAFIVHLRSRSHSRERITRMSGGHRPIASHQGRSPPHMGGGGPSRGGHVSVHSRLGAMPPPANEDPMQRELAERDMYMRDRERQVSWHTEDQAL